MSQKERDRLKILHEASKAQITQKQAAEQLGLTNAMFGGLQGSCVTAEMRRWSMHFGDGPQTERPTLNSSGAGIEELSREPCYDFGPTFAAQHLSKLLEVNISRDTVRRWMVAAGLWQSRKRTVQTIHQWRERRACFGELVQWDTSVHDWLEGRGERLYLIAMIDDATSRVYARFVRHDSAEENMRVVWAWLERYGRPLAFYTDKAAMFETAAKSSVGWKRRGHAADADYSCVSRTGNRAHLGS